MWDSPLSNKFHQHCEMHESYDVSTVLENLFKYSYSAYTKVAFFTAKWLFYR